MSSPPMQLCPHCGAPMPQPARRELLSLVPSPASWEAEMNAALQGMHGPVLTAEQIELACREYMGSGAFAAPNIRHFRAFLRKAAEPIQQEVSAARVERVAQNGAVIEAHRVVSDIRALIRTQVDAHGGRSRFIPKAAVEAMGATIVRAYDEVGGAERFLGASGDKLSFLVRDMAAALSPATGVR